MPKAASMLKRKRHAADEKVLDRRTERHDKAPLLKSAETDAVHAEKLQLLVAFSVIICGYGECDFKTNALDVFEEEDAPLNAWDHTLSHETALHLAASLSYALAADAECIVFALILLERLGREALLQRALAVTAPLPSAADLRGVVVIDDDAVFTTVRDNFDSLRSAAARHDAREGNAADIEESDEDKD
ncbi:hypothetical protein AB1Y20_014211 [Prymnesium parvum]|uniref:Uncharacterized protein n=1 Tax=Prymnesium parvum TaxID=97485 RepID=A0AB34IEC3_PRYPA